ncbi:YheV family putative zinc ribbon protein [Halomonas shantousis]
MATTKRFIAGAICPRCAAMDRIRSWEQNGVRYRDCVSCDFFEQLPIENDATLQEPETRISRTREPSRDNSDFQAVKILDPKGPGKPR